jgi:hypothetical protein
MQINNKILLANCLPFDHEQDGTRTARANTKPEQVTLVLMRSVKFTIHHREE